MRFDGFDLFLFDPHIDIDASDDADPAIWPTRPARGTWRSARSSPRSGRRPAAARPWASRRRRKFLGQVRKACRIAERLRELGVRPNGVVRIDSACRVEAWCEDPRATRSASPRPSARPARSPKTTASGWPPKAKSAGAACTVGGGWSSCWKWSIGRKTLGFQADMAHTLLYLLGYNAPEDALLPQDFDWRTEDQLRRGLLPADRRPAALDDRLPRGPERRHGARLRLARQDRPALPARRSPTASSTFRTTPAIGSATRRAELTKRFRHICWDGCMFPNAVMMQPRPGTTSWGDDRRPRRMADGVSGMSANVTGNDVSLNLARYNRRGPVPVETR